MQKPQSQSQSQFQFITITHAKDLTSQRVARSHAVTQGLAQKRELRRREGRNFRNVRFVVENEDKDGLKKGVVRSERRGRSERKDDSGADEEVQCLPIMGCMFSPPSWLHMLAAASPSLQVLNNNQNPETTEPQFSISDELVLQNFHEVIQRNLHDRALVNAALLTFSLACTCAPPGGDGEKRSGIGIDGKCIAYQNEAMGGIRERIGALDVVGVGESTVGAILLLAGVEARLGMPRQVQMHMGAIYQLLDICRQRGVYLSDEVKRAIFWQDLNSSVMTGSSRVVDHTTFPELQWSRDRLSADSLFLPPGFQAQAHLLGTEFVDLLKDVYALQCIRDSTFFGSEDVISMARIDNHQASIQSRLVSLPYSSSISECCHLGAYLCSAMLRCKLWRSSTIPSYLSLQLLCKLQHANDDIIWDHQPGLLAWLLYIGGAFAPTGTIRSDFVGLLHLNRSTRLKGLDSSWLILLEELKQFIWSETAFLAQVKAFWEESFI